MHAKVSSQEQQDRWRCLHYQCTLICARCRKWVEALRCGLCFVCSKFSGSDLKVKILILNLCTLPHVYSVNIIFPTCGVLTAGKASLILPLPPSPRRRHLRNLLIAACIITSGQHCIAAPNYCHKRVEMTGTLCSPCWPRLPLLHALAWPLSEHVFSTGGRVVEKRHMSGTIFHLTLRLLRRWPSFDGAWRQNFFAAATMLPDCSLLL